MTKELMVWSDDIKWVVSANKSRIELSESEISYIVTGALEGGIGHWACLDNTTKAWEGRDVEKTFLSDYATKIILDGDELTFEVEDMEEKTYTLTLEKILKGVELNAIHREFDADIDDADIITYDCIVQYGIFGELMFG